MIEHNLLSASKLYTNIRLNMCSLSSRSPLFLFSRFTIVFGYSCRSFEELGTLLGIPPHKVCAILLFLILRQNFVYFLLMILDSLLTVCLN